jgi:UDP-3-O-[3-hydroxymyristoyl] glucosamine N-acyltransferase
MFIEKKTKIKASKIAKFLKLKLNFKDFYLNGASSINNIKNNKLYFLTDVINKKFSLIKEKTYNLKKLNGLMKVLVITDKKNSKKIHCPKLISKNPRYDFQKILNEFFVIKSKNLIHKSAIIKNKKNIGKNVNIGANSFLDKDVTIGKNSVILNNVVITGKVSVGANCVIKSNSTIGSEGYGFSQNNKQYVHFPHIGGIEIGNRVWIGSNVSIEKGSMDNTVIKDDVLIDDLVQIGHNVIVGKRTQITAGCILSGKSVVGSDCWLAPNASVDNDVMIGNFSIIGMGSVVRKNVKSKTVVVGNPAKKLKKLK